MTLTRDQALRTLREADAAQRVAAQQVKEVEVAHQEARRARKAAILELLRVEFPWLPDNGLSLGLHLGYGGGTFQVWPHQYMGEKPLSSPISWRDALTTAPAGWHNGAGERFLAVDSENNS